MRAGEAGPRRQRWQDRSGCQHLLRQPARRHRLCPCTGGSSSGQAGPPGRPGSHRATRRRRWVPGLCQLHGGFRHGPGGRQLGALPWPLYLIGTRDAFTHHLHAHKTRVCLAGRDCVKTEFFFRDGRGARQLRRGGALQKLLLCTSRTWMHLKGTQTAAWPLLGIALHLQLTGVSCAGDGAHQAAHGAKAPPCPPQSQLQAADSKAPADAVPASAQPASSAAELTPAAQQPPAATAAAPVDPVLPPCNDSWAAGHLRGSLPVGIHTFTDVSALYCSSPPSQSGAAVAFSSIYKCMFVLEYACAFWQFLHGRGAGAHGGGPRMRSRTGRPPGGTPAPVFTTPAAAAAA